MEEDTWLRNGLRRAKLAIDIGLARVASLVSVTGKATQYWEGCYACQNHSSYGIGPLQGQHETSLSGDCRSWETSDQVR